MDAFIQLPPSHGMGEAKSGPQAELAADGKVESSLVQGPRHIWKRPCPVSGDHTTSVKVPFP